ncbi:hypothetical protein JHK87_050155 [Glycine soja]|nr:hypothetical protein JHK87_050155 [Glycine soja]
MNAAKKFEVLNWRNQVEMTLNMLIHQYIEVVKEEGLEISQPALDPDSIEIHHRITVKARTKKVHCRLRFRDCNHIVEIVFATYPLSSCLSQTGLRFHDCNHIIEFAFVEFVSALPSKAATPTEKVNCAEASNSGPTKSTWHPTWYSETHVNPPRQPCYMSMDAWPLAVPNKQVCSPVKGTSPSRRVKLGTPLNHVHPDMSRFQILVRTFGTHHGAPVKNTPRLLVNPLTFIHG